MDSGSRRADQALGAWLEETLTDEVSDVRFQTGFFRAEVLGHFVGVLARREVRARMLIGSNDGATRPADVEALRQSATRDGADRLIGVVSFRSGYFHPKTIYVMRSDGSAAAYVGSANLTGSGVASGHVEAGLLLESRDGDSLEAIASVGAAVERWFVEQPDGLTIIRGSDDVTRLAETGVLSAAPPPGRRRSRADGQGREAHVLRRLVSLPPLPQAIQGLLARDPPAAVDPEITEDDGAGESAQLLEAEPVVAEWTKRLPASDAQRKRSGNQSGAIALTRSTHRIDAQTYFRYEFFAGAQWLVERTRTGMRREVASVPVRAVVLGDDLGDIPMKVTYAENRESGQNNYTSLLHLGPLSDVFHSNDLTDRVLALRRLADGTFSLTIS